MVWKEQYAIGIETVDRQHKELFARVGDFLAAVRSATPWEEKLSKVKETIGFMQNYVVEHFNDEEAYQREIGYPDSERHRKIHEDFTVYVTECAQRFESEGYTKQGVQQFAGKLLAWLVNHVVAEDLKMAKYIGLREENHG